MNRHEFYPPAQSTNEDLVGIPGSRSKLDTPCLLVDLAVLKDNINRAAEMVSASGKKFLPHLKAHKTPQIAALQRAAGAAGFCVASIGEAEVFVGSGDMPITITSAVVTDRQMARIAALASKTAHLTVTVDTPATVRKLSGLDARLSVLIDIDMGRGRSACMEEAQAVHLARAVLNTPNLSLGGLQCYAGHLSHMNEFAGRKRKAVEADKRAQSFLAAVSSIAEGPLRCSGGSTGASHFDVQSTALTELQWGSYSLMDEEYRAVEDSPQATPLPFQIALYVATRAISTGQPDHAIFDAGDKRFASKYGAAPKVAAPVRYKGTDFRPLSDEHGELRGSPLPSLGEIIEVIPPHCDPTVNLFDVLHVVEGDTLVDIWPVSARGVY